ncbi:tRNA (adenosine(37)-N6)-threonylcarbamoyltransferase complex dimerization subunit type 1 TsaB [Algoriphagus halophytocola]|uniref:tRNA (Adenosine(37)-N6)-threonylcarbamoyltransferase complex dimerization subunit type 1 TsaB n=1 Tax=Algoriphagus halophytocola TaxID=2991499 RepID=A0ABY6MIG0_9BACT|nr:MULTISPECIES: tRNA (adenosine(37)-N6)-threonylcarbamoyltransferase complex dimerization subunit type 1 TsaB [unclassified Algoriphagus]UZD22207.1 tRNA (adenosine(37)-N6)-threonylcarbamoyltransferase complex dimerization subunit type 1 TsaB [Algoriphagus sp. TR-M5]WBL43457.1 tRNA (adenosine(37)-N6)-threonylcarbamoyltransferase complex dimerization subunit type 1 TsaB [Algoriphagus sp. TR-M9]
MPTILSIETSTPVCSVALHHEGVFLAEKSIHEKGAHSEKLMGMIGDLLKQTGIDATQIDAVAVSEGPGSYTGLRIGVSVAKGLAFGWNIPMIGVSTLKALAWAACVNHEDAPLIIAMLDARRQEVYREVFDRNLDSLANLDAEVLDENSFGNYLEQSKVYFVGDANLKASRLISHDNAIFLEIEISAKYIGDLALELFEKSEFVDLAYFVPNYLKEFKALQSKKNPLLI